MSTAIIGGPLKCSLHEFETEDINEWNDHCEQSGHTETGETACINCGTSIKFENIPYQRITPRGKNIQLKCEECYNNSEDLNKLLYSGNNSGAQVNNNNNNETGGDGGQ